MIDHLADLSRLQQRTSAKWRAYPQDVIPAWIAEMDVELAPPIAEALHAAVSRSDTGYRWAGDLPAALAGFALARWGWHVDPEQVVVVPDVVTGICEAMDALTLPGESVVINPPVYPPFFSSVRRVNRVIVEVPLIEEPDSGYHLDIDGLEAAFARPEVTGYVLCSPHNPTGTLPSRDELERIAHAAAANGVAVIADEIHAPLTHPQAEFVPYLTVADPDVPAVSVVSTSKAWNLAGLKCAQLVAGSTAVTALLAERIPIEVTYGTGHLGVLASTAAYREGIDWLDETVGQLAARAAELASLLGRLLPEIGYRPPPASYLAWLDCRALNLGDDPSEAFLERAKVALSPGPSFGEQGAGFARLNFGTSPEILHAIVERMAAVA